MVAYLVPAVLVVAAKRKDRDARTREHELLGGGQ
jgi:hypothetical protein